MIDFTGRRETLPEQEHRIGGAIRQLRIDAGLSQQELAERANISRSAVQSLETGAGTRLRTLLAILRVLDRADAFDSIMPMEGPSPLEVLAEARRRDRRSQRYRKPGS